jgi:hypothetical protein
MRTTLEISDEVMRRTKEKAAREGKTMTELVESALRSMLAERPRGGDKLLPLPSFDMGKPQIDIADRDALYDLFDQDRTSLNAPHRHKRTRARRQS